MKKRCDLNMGTVLPTAVIIVVLILLIPPVTSSVEPSGNDTSTTLDPTGMLRLQASAIGGIGLERSLVGATTDNKEITISAGSGLGLDLAAGLYLNSLIEISGSLGYQRSGWSVPVKDAEGSFRRFFMRSTLKVRIPLSDVSRIYVGAGSGFYGPANLDLRFGEVDQPDQVHFVYSYKNTTGIHLIGGFETPISSWSLGSAKVFGGVGLRYNRVKYDLESVTANGFSIPINSLSQEAKEEFMELDGSGLDILLYLTIYL